VLGMRSRVEEIRWSGALLMTESATGPADRLVRCAYWLGKNKWKSGFLWASLLPIPISALI
jgi:hypothetical protein